MRTYGILVVASGVSLREWPMAASPEIQADGFVIEEALLKSLRLFIADWQQQLSLQLQDCEAITVASDYFGFVSNFDTGFGPHERPEVSERGVGFAPETLRSGKLGSHVILPRTTIEAFDGRNPELSASEARNVIVHELAHADEHRRTAEAFRDEVLALHSVDSDGIQIGRKAVWNEYYACRTVAKVNPSTVTLLERSVKQTVEEFGNDCSAARQRVAVAQNRERVESELWSSAFRFFLDAARLLGHLDGLELDLASECPAANDYLSQEQMAEAFGQLHETLRSLWDLYPAWAGLEELKTIPQIINFRLNII
jgi:hypothetical protein